MANLEATGGGEGVEWLKNEPYDNTDGHWDLKIDGYSVPKNKGQYTLKHYLVASKVPGWLTKLLPAEAMILEEEAWCSDDYRYSVFTNGYLSRQKFHIILEMKILKNDKGENDNVFNLSEEEKKQRYVEFYDMCDVYKSETIPESEDLTKLKIDNIPGSPLQPGWYKNWDINNMSCQYWLLHIDFKFFGFQTIGENMVYNQQCYMNRVCERQMTSTIDKWKNLTIEDIRKMESENMEELKEKIKSKEIALA
ncbi:uncharacterized protein [Blastocystis hominis]|uniref:Phosphatidylinositol transfer protein N-terminal domain-containing protein n=1 Tax=Blastocystis hominis TaxID=12968 RepID=D8MBN7_BLAHO|nr:uncharacterized protein [Blastocystis hominis]CBK25476.2 unnamed protein product [Blastocystis hominis]|eukprot:XP_012899524.1 uncharacterized protein [Blastocystis hominis]